MTIDESHPGTAAPSVRRSRSRAALWIGLGLIGSGLAILGWLGWQFWGTNWISHRTQTRVIATLHEDWAQGKSVTLVSVGDDEPVRALAIVRIPRFGSSYAVPVLAGTSDAVLAAGFGHYSGGAPPGGVGNFAIAGHRVTHGEPLRRMPELQVGDQIIVETMHRVYTYDLDLGGDDLTVPLDATWVTDPLPTNPDGSGVQPPNRSPHQQLLTLTTCSELFHTDNRLVAFGHLVSSRAVR